MGTNISSLDKSNDENENIDNLQQKTEEDVNENDSKADIHPKDITRFVNDEDNLGMVAVLRGDVGEGNDDDHNEDNDNDNEDEDDQLQGGKERATAFFERNLSNRFDTAEEVDQPGLDSMIGLTPHQFQERKNDTVVAAAAPAVDVKCLRRPPLAPSRDGLKAPPETQPDGMDAGDDKRLSVFLRIRPPVGANREKGNEGSRNTIRVISDSITAQGLPSTIRTHPPPNSNAAKVAQTRSHASSDSLNGNRSCDSGVDNAKDRGVKEYSYSGVFGPNATQKKLYDKVAAPLVDGIFPKSNEDNDLGESALLFPLGVTKTGKNPAADDYDETQNVLSCAKTAQNVDISAREFSFKRGFLAKGRTPGKSKKLKLSSEMEDHLRHENENLKKQLQSLSKQLDDCRKNYEQQICKLNIQIALLQSTEKEELATTAASAQVPLPHSDAENASEIVQKQYHEAEKEGLASAAASAQDSPNTLDMPMSQQAQLACKKCHHHFNELKEFKALHGHCNVPYSYEENRRLGVWVHNQRYLKKTLDDIGFVWDNHEDHKENKESPSNKCVEITATKKRNLKDMNDEERIEHLVKPVKEKRITILSQESWPTKLKNRGLETGRHYCCVGNFFPFLSTVNPPFIKKDTMPLSSDKIDTALQCAFKWDMSNPELIPPADRPPRNIFEYTMSSFRDKNQESYLFNHQKIFTESLIRLISLATALNTRQPPSGNPTLIPKSWIDIIDSALKHNCKVLCNMFEQDSSLSESCYSHLDSTNFGFKKGLDVVKTIRPRCNKFGEKGGVAISYYDLPKTSDSGVTKILFDGFYLHEIWIIRHFLTMSLQNINFLGKSTRFIDFENNELINNF